LSMSCRSNVESLSILLKLYKSPPSSRTQLDEIDPMPWLQLFQSFPSVQRLNISATLERYIAASLKGLTGESAAHVFPLLQNINIFDGRIEISKPIPRDIQSFVAARQHFSHPVPLQVLRWNKNWISEPENEQNERRG
jgi:hypothetical protein